MGILDEYAKGKRDFRGTSLCYANLSGADLRYADLVGADLRYADLRKADLRGANLEGVNLKGANLEGTDLVGADLRYAHLRGADLRGADLASANLAGADLATAYLPDANLYCANLAGANLSGANLAGADLKGAILPPFQIPQEGELIVWKKLHAGIVCKLRISPEAKRTASLVGRKCRAEFAEVLEGEGVAMYDQFTRYTPGEVVRPDRYDDDIRVECTGGIHFFLTREEAEAY